MISSRSVSWLFTVGVIVAAAFLLSVVGLMSPLRSGVLLVAEPFEAGVRNVSSPLVELIGNVGSYGEVRDENRDLRTENERLRADLARLREDQSRAADLAELANVRSLRPDDTFSFAAVIARDPNPLRRVVMINRGSGDGLREGMPVLGRGGALIGTVEQTQDGAAWVRLITDARSDVNAVIQESRAFALASGQPDGSIAMQFLAEGVEVKPGDTVLTSGLGGTYPNGLLIGRVARVEGNTLDVFKGASVEPTVRLAALENVAVLTSFQPLRLGSR